MRSEGDSPVTTWLEERLRPRRGKEKYLQAIGRRMASVVAEAKVQTIFVLLAIVRMASCCQTLS